MINCLIQSKLSKTREQIKEEQVAKELNVDEYLRSVMWNKFLVIFFWLVLSSFLGFFRVFGLLNGSTKILTFTNFSSTLPDSERNVCNKTNQQGTITNHKRTINERVKTFFLYFLFG